MLEVNYFEKVYDALLSDQTRKKTEKVILSIAIASFLVHLALIFLVDYHIIDLTNNSELLKNPIAAIYTPFSFILVYEVYLLIYYLPKSITTYIGKQYEIISLIIIRRLFKDLSNLSLSPDWFNIKYDLQFTYDLVASVLLFFLIYQFYKFSKQRQTNAEADKVGSQNYIKLKKRLAASLVIVIFAVAIFAFISWLFSAIHASDNHTVSFKNINNIFFEQFFTILIVVDVILLLFSFFHTDTFYVVFRNSGFIISTILIRISFSVTGILNTLLILSAILFGLLILMISKKFEKQLFIQNKAEETNY
jgi:hypothetical protein